MILVLHTVFTPMPDSFSSAASHLSCSCLPCLPVHAVTILVRAAVNYLTTASLVFKLTSVCLSLHQSQSGIQLCSLRAWMS